nr:MAG TPA: hypothetical protein [Caudoviricetes sp.]
MGKKNFELFMCCLGNGITVCNKAVEENGDYKRIAHIAECGKITWYVNLYKYVPGDALLKIEHCADVQHEKWEKWLASMPEPQQYEKLLDAVPVNVMLYVCNLGGGLGRKISYLKNVCYEKSYF